MMLNGTEPAEFDCLDMLNSTMLEVVNETLVSFCPEPNNHATGDRSSCSFFLRIVDIRYLHSL